VNGTPGDTPDTEFSNLALYIGPDNSATGLGTAVDTLGGASLLAATTQVCYNGACGSGGTNYQSVDSGNYYAIYAVTFSDLNISLAAGTYDFAVGDTPIGNNTFALLMSDPANTSGGSESSAGLSPNGFLYFFADGTGSSPLETYQYDSSSGLITNYNNNADVNVNITAVPEPTTFGMIGLGLAAFAFMRRRTRQA
jgi:hypothetical protein